jgi:predicted RNA-binding protein with PIN domain
VTVLIDGNNLLFAARAAEESNLLIGRSMLCDRLGMWARRRHETVHVVFDGPAPAPALASQIAHPDIHVSYSGGGVSADAVVVDILENHSAARLFVVVTTDREIARAAKRRRAKPVRSEVFWAALKKDLACALPLPSEPPEKEVGLDPGAAREWLQEFGFDEQPPE